MNKVKEVILFLLQTIFFVSVSMLAVFPISCKLTETGIEIAGGDYSAPILEDVTIENETTVILRFSEKVKIKQAIVSPIISGISDSDLSSTTEELSVAIKAAIGGYDSIPVTTETAENGTEIFFNFEKSTQIGKKYELFGVVEDEIGNSLTFAIPFTGYNSKIPNMIMTELHTGMASQLTGEQSLNIRRLEFVEFLVLSDGNLVGLELCSGYVGEGKKYSFPPVEVHKGEIIVFHPRTWGDGCISEEGEALDLAFSKYAQDDVRDLWSQNTTRAMGDVTDILILRNSITNQIIDAVMYRSEELEEWSDKLKTDFSFDSGVIEIYGSGDVENATVTTGLSSSKFLCRSDCAEIYEAIIDGEELEFPIKADSSTWKITSDATPGRL